MKYMHYQRNEPVCPYLRNCPRVYQQMLDDGKTGRLLEFNVGEKVLSRAFVVQAFIPRFFNANIESQSEVRGKFNLRPNNGIFIGTVL